MDTQSQQAADKIKQASNILVTVSNNPSVDQLAACIGVTLALNRFGKHATAVFSGAVPSTIEFLQPESTIERNTDSLRDFIVALDKSKADKLRYKVEDQFVKIFITPYRTSLSEKDLEFSQGDFNVDVVLALGVHNQTDIDQAIVAHGRILHDATIITVNTQPGSELGGINWVDTASSSLSELSAQLIRTLDSKLFDSQIATALLTGIVAATDRFSNAHTYPQTMTVSAELMAAGADQQLVSARLEPPAPVPIATPEVAPVPEVVPQPENNEISIDNRQVGELAQVAHDQKAAEAARAKVEEEKVAAQQATPDIAEIHIDEHGVLQTLNGGNQPAASQGVVEGLHDGPPKLMTEPPSMGGQMSAASQGGIAEGLGAPSPEDVELPSGGVAPSDGFLVGQAPSQEAVGFAPTPPVDLTSQQSNPSLQQPEQPTTTAPSFPLPDETLSQIEHDVHSPHVAAEESQSPDVDSARTAVEDAINYATTPRPPEPVTALNAQPIDLGYNHEQGSSQMSVDGPVIPVLQPPSFPQQPTVVQPANTVPMPQQSTPVVEQYNPNAPPPVPPPMMPPSGQF